MNTEELKPKTPTAAEQELETVNAKLAATENLRTLYPQRHSLKAARDAAREYADRLTSEHKSAQLDEESLGSRKSQNKELLDSLTVSLQRLRSVAKAESITAVCESLNTWDDAIQAVEFFLDAHADKVVRHKRAVAHMHLQKRRVEAQHAGLDKDLTSIETTITELTSAVEAE